MGDIVGELIKLGGQRKMVTLSAKGSCMMRLKTPMLF
jgi:hypothetical protein